MTGTQTENRVQTEAQTAGEAKAPLRVCFVCTGNTCRSPMAAAVANAMAYAELQALPPSIRELTAPRIEAFSAGLYAAEGDPIAPHAVQALEAAGISPCPGRDYHTHRAHTLCVEEAERYDLLIGLTRRHAMELLLQFPQLASRITAFPQEIADPWGGNEETYRRSLAEITQGVKHLLFEGLNL